MPNGRFDISTEMADTLEDDILTDDQIQALLSEAESRLRSGEEEQIALQSEPPKLADVKGPEPYISQNNNFAVADPSKLLQSTASVPPSVDAVAASLHKGSKRPKDTAGIDWFNLPKTDLTPEMKQDFEMLRMRNVLDPHRHYKKMNKAKLPEYSQVGTVVEGPTEFFSSRITKKDRKRTFVDEILAAEESLSRFRRKYNEIQDTKTSGKKAYYKNLMQKRGSRRKV